jgi:hypothetical protein
MSFPARIDCAVRCVPEPCEGFNQFVLAVSGNPGNAQNLAGMKGEINALNHLLAAVRPNF